MRTKLTWLMCAAVIVAAAPVSAAPITPVENGRAHAVIVVPNEKPSSAVADLRDFIEKATGAQLDVVEERNLGDLVGAGSRIFVGVCNATKRVVDLAQLQPEGFVIKSVANDLFIVGRDKTEGGM